MNPESVHARHVASAPVGKLAPHSTDRPDAVPGIAATAPEALARQVLLAQPGIAAVEEVQVTKRWGRPRGVMARIRLHGGADAHAVCRCAVEAMASQMNVVGVCLMTAAAPGDPEL